MMHRSRVRTWQLWALAALFLGPLAAAFWLHFGLEWRPQATTNHGQLVSPAAPLPAVPLPTPEGDLTDPQFLRGRWSLVYVGGNACDAACREELREARQVRLALGRLMDHLQRVYLYGGAPPDSEWLAAEHPDLLAANLEGADGSRLRDALPSRKPGYWLVDPDGNAMMRYEPDVRPKDMLADVKTLLRGGPGG